jgi:glutamine amidotransferase
VSVAETPYCGKFSSIIAKDNIVGVQFHPEKSSKPGFRLIKNFLAI